MLYPQAVVIQYLGGDSRSLTSRISVHIRVSHVDSDWFNKKIKEMDVQNSYFPMFVSAKVLEREKDHIEGFSPEVAWVTRA
jgi:prolyl-tRNA synthetase